MYCYKKLLVMLLGFGIAQVHAAEWRECEKQKIRQLNLAQAAHANALGSRSKKHLRRRADPDKARQEANQLDEWLWKNCRSYANELRSLEQERM